MVSPPANQPYALCVPAVNQEALEILQVQSWALGLAAAAKPRKKHTFHGKSCAFFNHCRAVVSLTVAVDDL